MDPSNNNSFGSFSYGGRAGVGAPVQQDMFLAPAAPEKKSKKGIILIALLVVLVCLGGGLLLLMNNNSSSETTATEALDRLKKAANYAYYCSEETSVDLESIRLNSGCLASKVARVSVFVNREYNGDSNSENDIIKSNEDFFEKAISLFEKYTEYSSKFYSDDNEEGGFHLRSNDTYIMDIIKFLDVYVIDTPVITENDFTLAKEDYVKKLENVSVLGSEVSDDYMALQEDLYDSTRELMAVYLARGCESGANFTNECVAGIELNEEENRLAEYRKATREEVEGYGKRLVNSLFSRCAGNEKFFVQDEETENE